MQIGLCVDKKRSLPTSYMIYDTINDLYIYIYMLCICAHLYLHTIKLYRQIIIYVCICLLCVLYIYIYVYIMYENENFVMQCKRNTIDDNNVKQRTLIRNQLMHLSTKKTKNRSRPNCCYYYFPILNMANKIQMKIMNAEEINPHTLRVLVG